MNKVILMGRLTRDPEVKYTRGEPPMTIAHYTLAVPRKVKRENELDADFVNCVAFGKTGEFAQKYLQKGKMICICGEIRVRSYTNQEGQRIWTTEVIAEEHYFAGSNAGTNAEPKNNIPDVLDDTDLPF